MKRRSDAKRSVPFDPDVPPRIDGLTKFQRIGRGGFSTVWRAEQPAMGRSVAVKLIDAPLTDPQARARFEAEAARAGRLGEHPSIATVYFGGVTDGRPYLVMRLYSRGSMKDRLDPGRGIPVEDVLAYGVQIADALKFAHDQQIVHRDVKPENILQDSLTGQAVLTDFGIAADHSAGPPGDPRGLTVPYASPELLRGENMWPPCDVWSLAATLYTLLAGRPPYTDFTGRENPRAISDRALRGPLPPLGPDVPPEVFAVLEAALVGPVDARTAWASPFAQQLNDVQRALGFEPTPRVTMASSTTPTVPDPTPAPTLTPTPTAATATGIGTTAYTASGHTAMTGPAPDVQPQTAANLPPHTSLTSNVGTDFHYKSAPAPAPTRKRPPWKAIAIGGGIGLVLSAGIYFATDHGASASPNAAPTPAKSASASATPDANASASPASGTGGGASAPKPPTNVSAVAVSNGTAVRLSWTDTAPAGQYQVVLSLGRGYSPRTLPDSSPQVISGLVATRPYCFAVGYLYTLDGAVSYSTTACIRGGVAG